MKIYQKLNRYPLGAIQAGGFLRDQMLRGKDGICGHLHELEPGMIADPYINKSYVKAWGDGDQSGWGGEISGNYWTGYIQFAYTLNDPEMIAVATNWVDTMIKKQKPDGYLGTYYEEDAKIYEDYNAWGTACAMRGLIAFYEATGRTDVLEAVHRCMLWFCDKWSGDHKTSYAGPFIIEPMVFTYYHTGDERLIDFAKEYAEYLCDHDIFKISYKSMLTERFHYHSNHSAGLGTSVRLPALLYSVTGEEQYLRASEKRFGEIYQKTAQITGSPACEIEYASPVGAVAETEYCSYSFYNISYSYMSYITGETGYGDMMEQLFYNGAQGARKKDEKAIAYMNSPNQIYATDLSSYSIPDQQVYAPCYPTSCCPVAAVTVVPEFVRGMLLHDDDENVYVMAYGPCTLRHGETALTLDTLYPFRNSVLIKMECNKHFALNLKIPAWSRGYTVSVNGEAVAATAKEGYVAISRDWKTGDAVTIDFAAEVETVVIDDSDNASKHPIAIRYGALVFAYHIPEIWYPVQGHPMTPLPEGWSWYYACPDYKPANVQDPHEEIGLRRNQISWNVALDETLSAKDFTIEELPANGYVWENPPIRLHTHCYKAPYMCPPYPQRTYETNCEYQYVTERLPLVLEPYGCTNLRITYFPKADLKK
ncbi:MAG: glycoside hydrolase family 127 protein [Clostridia bacterium]|nr:glycoside hydrolase family 127 protein [Clostridia bacterium]